MFRRSKQRPITLTRFARGKISQGLVLPPEETLIWCKEKDIRISLGLLGIFARPRLLEVGVFKGGFIFAMLLNAEGSEASGVDPYPWHDGKRIREETLDLATRLGLSKRFALYDFTEQIDANSLFHLVHLDGCHSQQALIEDLTYADGVMATNGILVIDDYRNPYFPGVSAAAYSFLSLGAWSLFALTEEKMYLCRPEQTNWVQDFLGDVLDSLGIPWTAEFGSNGSQWYSQSASVFGVSPMLILD